MASEAYFINTADSLHGRNLTPEGHEQAVKSTKALIEREIGMRTVLLYANCDSSLETAKVIIEGVYYLIRLPINRRYSSNELLEAGRNPDVVENLGQFLEYALAKASLGKDNTDEHDSIVAVAHAPLIAAVRGMEEGQVRAGEVYDADLTWHNPTFDETARLFYGV